MKNLYRIENEQGVVTHQVAEDENQAVEFAKMYGMRGKRLTATFVREN